MKPFFSFYGGKWRAAPKYPQPVYNRIFEPFAGSAGYSVRYADRDVVLVEKDPKIADLWRYLISASSSQILALPLDVEHVDDLSISDAEKYLIGFWLNKGAAQPCKSPSSWMRQKIRADSYWGGVIRQRIADQVDRISHWTLVEGDYTDAGSERGTWFIDPPYEKAGALYRMSSKAIDFSHLAGWCLFRQGQVIVCENDGATWLPFRPYLVIKSTEGRHGKSKSAEAIWTNDQPVADRLRSLVNAFG